VGPPNFNLCDKVYIPFAPSTYKVVFKASTGIKNILNTAAQPEAAKVFIAEGNSTFYNKASAPAFAAVSPNLPEK
jgi:hypothetical protein